MTGPRL